MNSYTTSLTTKKTQMEQRMTSKEPKLSHLITSVCTQLLSKTCSWSQSYNNPSLNVVLSILQMCSRNASRKPSSVLMYFARPYLVWERPPCLYSPSSSALVKTHNQTQPWSCAITESLLIRLKENSCVFQSSWKMSAPKSFMAENQSKKMSSFSKVALPLILLWEPQEEFLPLLRTSHST